ncbi:non-ribosomal peptide synthetase/MFS transporter [Planomonospora sp. ID82291]|uniref:non-ribosomal peptide synthetase/MFS transporter n=1 Tax=Planomonospora sp. ID82291 TaxID=2738136 RepID=UPI0018C372E0|nr:non-ribosomal peptide synthetase/MFS transporter [Planomonospora sp. ID82291]MBG0815686.1 amino acid adenylation domain-containing protein [Planomonospora sp. ID82291]
MLDEQDSRVATLSPAKRALLLRRLRGDAGAAASPIPRRPAGTPAPLTFSQERVWFLDQLDPGDAAFTMCLAQRWRGRLDLDALRDAVAAVVARHESLRTRFRAEDGTPVQEVVPDAAVAVEFLDHAEAGPGAPPPEEWARAAVARRTNTPFSLAEAPLLRVSVLRLGTDDHVVCVVCHHIVADGVSLNIFAEELAARYGAGPAYEPPPLPVQYADFAVWQRERLTEEAAGRSLAYWTARLADPPVLELPADRPRPAVHSSRGGVVTVTLGAEPTAALEGLAARHGATPFMTLLAAYQALLARHTGQEDVCVGSPIAGRDRVELEPLIGFFLNTLVLRGDLSGDPAFGELLDRTRTAVLDAFDHQDIPFEQVMGELRIERDLSRSALFQTMFVLHTQNDRRAAPPGLRPPPETPDPPTGRGIEEITGFDTGYTAAKFDLSLDAWRTPDGLSLVFGYAADLFDRDTVAALADRFTRLLTAVAADPGLRLSEIDLLSGDDRRTILEWSVNTAPPAAQTVPELFAAAVAARPDAPAVTCAGRTLTYAELDARADALARALRGAGAGPESVVAVAMDRSPDLLAALLAVWKAGGAYLPLDPAYPPSRQAAMLGDSGARVVLTTAALSGRLPDGPHRVLCADGGLPAAPGDPDPGPLPAPDPGRAAYVIYTSGSTGRPKGVVVEHGALAARVGWMREAYRLTPADRVLQFATVSFDTHAEEIYPCLAAGATLVLLPGGGEFLPDFLATPYARDLTVLDLPTPYWHELVTDLDTVDWPPGLRLTILGADQAQAAAVTAWHRHFGGRVRLMNTYGPTEATVIASAAELREGDRRPPIGRPIAATSLYVLDERRRLAPVGVPGELYIGGAGLARGYLGRPGLTAERFVPDPYGGGRLYRSGDRARWRPDGELEFLGRADDQVKVRGYRIEPGEVESCLLAHPAVAQAVVLAERGNLLAYVVPTADSPTAGTPTVGTPMAGTPMAGAAMGPELREHVARALPAHMVPAAVTVVDRLPLTPNGKLDRAALPAPEFRGGSGHVAPATPTEQAIADIWAQVLGIERVGAEDDFFALGGHSLLATQVIARMRRALGAGVSLMDLFRHPTVRGLAALADTPADARRPRRLLHELTPPLPQDRCVLTYVCVPYGGGSAVVYQPLADALPEGYRLLSLAVPGHDVGLAEDPLPFDELAARCAAEVLEQVTGPVAVYGHSSVGSALAVEVARRLEAAGRAPEAVYIGAAFPFARPRGRVMNALSRLARASAVASDRAYGNWLASMGVDLSELTPEQALHIVRTMRAEAEHAERYFTGLLDGGTARLRAPLVTIAGERDPATEYYQERYREWHFLSATSVLVVLEEAGHFFVRYRAGELAEIVTTAHLAAAGPAAAPAEGPAGGPAAPAGGPVAPAGESVAGPALPREGDGGTWWLGGVSRSPGAARSAEAAEAPEAAEAAEAAQPPGPEPSMRRFLAVASGQLVSITGSALTEFAVPIWIYLTTGSVADFALFAVLGLVPGLLVAPLAGAVVDRVSRRKVMLCGDIAALCTQLALGVLLWTGNLQIWHIYPLLVCLSVALTFQRLAYGSAIPQLVPKRYLGHANGVNQMVTGVSQLLVPLAAAGLVAGIGLEGILLLDVVSYLFAVGVLVIVRFPRTMAHRRRETVTAEIVEGFRYSWGNRGFRSMLLFFAALNVFLSPLFLMISPLVLSFGTLGDVGRVSFASGMGVFVGGLVMSVWGGPQRLRVRGMLLFTLALGLCCLVTGVRADLLVIGAGAFGMSMALTLVNGIYATIVQVKVAQRFHGRVFALNTMIAWSTTPIGLGLVAPYASAVLEPLMTPDGPLAPTLGTVLGTGPGRGIGLMYVVCAAMIIVIAGTALRLRPLARFDRETVDSVPDDVLGSADLMRRGLAHGRAGGGGSGDGRADGGGSGGSGSGDTRTEGA